MRTTKLLLLTGATTALCAALTNPVQAQNASATVGPDTLQRNGVHHERLTDLNQSSTTMPQQTPVSRVNKASSLIGMDVRNPQNERLGEIKDIVVDLPSGKVQYAVLSVGGFLGIGDKYVAIPSNAFTLAPEQDRLVLNADKAKIQNAPGFAKNTWPDLHDKSWNGDSAYWLSGLDATAQGTIGATRSGTASEQSSSKLGTSSLGSDIGNRDSSATPNTYNSAPRSQVGSDRLNDRLDRRDASVNSKDTFHGKITAIDVEKRTVTVEGPSGSRQFTFTDRPTLVLKESRNPSLSDFKVGYPVNIGFHEENGSFMAHSIMRTDTQEVR